MLAALVLIGLPFLASGHSYRLGHIIIVHPWAMPTNSSITEDINSTGYLVLKNSGDKPDQLVSASAEIAKKIDLHTHNRESDRLKMQPTAPIEIPAGGEVRLEPGGPHLMLIGLEKSLMDGEHFPVVLKFQNAGEISVEMLVQKNARSSIY